MKRMGLTFVTIFLLLVLNASAYQYQSTYYMSAGTSGASLTTYPIPFYADNTGTLNLDLYLLAGYNTSSSFSYTGNFLSPYSTTYAITSGTDNGNTSCILLAHGDKDYTTSQIIENRNTLNNNADYMTIYSEGHFTYTTTDRYLHLYSGNVTDSEYYVANQYICNNCYPSTILGQTNISQYFNSDTIGRCIDNYNILGGPNDLTRAYYQYDITANPDIETYVLFNSTSGNITYSSHFYGDALDNRFHFIYPFDSPNTITALCNGASCSGTKTLDANTMYVYAVGGGMGGSGIKRVPDINLTIDLGIANYTYGAWSTCDPETGRQTRTCIDANGLQPNNIEIRDCSFIAIENATLGFEEYYTDFALKCVPNWGSLISYPLSGYCSYDMQTISRDTPLGWTVYEDYTDEGIQRDFLRMTSEWRTQGFRSLKMWYIPPKMGEPITNSTCGNATYGQIPLLYQNVSNSTFSVSYNVTFPAENMLLSFDVKGCPNQVEQNGPLAAFALEACPQQCYANNCSSVPDSSYQFFIKNSTGKIITNYYDVYADPYDSDTINLDLTGLGIVAGETYTLNFQAMPENLNSQNGNCVMFDNVRYSVLAEPYPVGCSVSSRCIGTNLYITHEYENGACVVVKKDNACGLPDDIIDKIANREDYCDLEDSDILMRYDYDISDWREIECEYGCLDDKCVTQEDIDEEAAALSLYDPPEILQDILVAFGLTQTTYGYIWFFLSLFMIVNYFGIGLGLAVSVFIQGETREGSKVGGKDMWIPFTVILFIVIVSATMGGFYPLEVGVPVIVGVGLLLWKNMEKIIGGGSG